VELQTASAVISFAKNLENDSAAFYVNAAQTYPEAAEVFLPFSEENKRNRILVERTYYEVISDALEAGFSFEGLNTDDYSIKGESIGGESYSDMLNRAIEMEGKVQEFYLAAAEKSRSLMADIPRVFERVARKRDQRKLKLSLLLEESCKND